MWLHITMHVTEAMCGLLYPNAKEVPHLCNMSYRLSLDEKKWWCYKGLFVYASI